MREADESLVGRTIAGKYAVLEVVGKGAMGCVYKARQLALDKIVALKLMHPGLVEDGTFAARFKREAKAASRLDHANSIRVIDFGEEQGGILYIAMEYVEGRSLLRLVLQEWPLAAPRIADIASQVLAALAVAHDMGIIHRDIKPENVLVASTTSDDGHDIDVVKVCDFGIAKISDARAYQTGGGTGPLTRSGTLIGTPEYMSPEQGRGDPLDARSDIYSVGVILFQLLTGKVPFEAESAIGIILKHITDPPPNPLDLNPKAHPRLAQICLRAMSKRREDRHQSARELRAELRAAVDGRAKEGSLSDAAIPLPSSGHHELSGTANTVTALVSGESSPSGAGGAASSTTESELAIPATPRWKIALTFAVAAALVGAGVLALQSHGASTGSAPAASGSSAEPPLAVLVADPMGSQIAPLTFPPDPSSRSAPRHATIAPPAPPRSVAPPSGALPSTTAASASSAAPPAPPPASSPPPSPPAPQPAPAAPYVMGTAWVDIGMVTGERVREDKVKRALGSVKSEMSGCYRAALAENRSHQTGIGVASFSFDEHGQVKGVAITDVQFLPSMARCLQQFAGRISVPENAVESGGGTATAQLIFNNAP